MQQHASGVDQRRIGGPGVETERVEDLIFEIATGLLDGVFRHLAGIDSSAQVFDRSAAGLHHGGVAVVFDRGLKGGEIEQTMDRRDMSVRRVHVWDSNALRSHQLGRRALEDESMELTEQISILERALQEHIRKWDRFLQRRRENCSAGRT